MGELLMLRKLAFIALLAGSVAFTPANASTVSVGQWYTFGFGGVGSALSSGATFVIGTNPSSIAAPDPSWDFTLASDGTLLVLDGFASVDQFQISDLGSIIGSTSAPVPGSSCGSDITCALNDPNFSRATFSLGAGSHSITGTALQSGLGAGAGFFFISAAAVPEPSTWAMMLLGFGAIGFSLRRRRSAAVQTA
jgi:hypothetical protein